MRSLESIRLVGLWSEDPITFALHKDVTFLIGVNGTGKTTVMNLISAALDVDYEVLASITFKSIELDLSKDPDKDPCAIVVRKEEVQEAPFIRVSYAISGDGGTTSLTYLQDYRFGLLRNMQARTRELNEELRTRIRELIKTTWLSVHRSTSLRTDDRPSESSVDKRLRQLSGNLGRFFSGLDSAASAESKSFQQSVFAALIPQTSFAEVMDMILSLDTLREKEAFEEIVNDFASFIQLSQPIDEYFAVLNGAAQKIRAFKDRPDKDNTTFLMTSEESRAIAIIQVIHSLVKSWESLKGRLQKIYEPRDSFLRILNERSWDKDFIIDAENELQAKLRSSQLVVSLSNLSSGEKQLIIILGEALLQRRQRMLYIADEPELSLHVSWQESLVDMIREINPRAQLLLATHSPDIVSHYSGNEYDMEKLRRHVH